MQEEEDVLIQVVDMRKPKWFEVDNVIVDTYLPKVGVYAFAVYCALARHADDGEITIPHKSIAALLLCSTKTVVRSIEELTAAGLLSLVSGKGAGTPNTYYILEPPSQGGVNG